MMRSPFSFKMHRAIRACGMALIVISALNSCKSAHQHPHAISKQGQITFKEDDFLYQYSIIDALMAGVFDGNLSLKKLKEKGDFGIGTFNKVNGELMMHQGKVYRIGYDSTVNIGEASDSDSTSAAFVKFFQADTVIHLTVKSLTYEKVQELLANRLNPNGIYALRIRGRFQTMTTRSERRAELPYTTLPELLKTNQVVFNLANTTGVCNGFLLPPYLARTNVPGFHMHYLADNLKEGGHVFNFQTDSVSVEIDKATGFIVENNTNAAFNRVNLKPDRGLELKKIE